MEGSSSSNCNLHTHEGDLGEYVIEGNVSRISQMSQEEADRFYQNRKNQILQLLKENCNRRLKRSYSTKSSPAKQKEESKQSTPRIQELFNSAVAGSAASTPRSPLVSSNSSSTINLLTYRKFDAQPKYTQRADVRNMSPVSLQSLKSRMSSSRRSVKSPRNKYDTSQPIYDRQMQWLNNIKEKTENELIQKTKAELENCTFKPYRDSLKSFKSPTEMYETQVKWKEEIDKRVKNLHTQKELEAIQECHFQPNVRKASPNVNFQEFYKRISDWNDKKQQKIQTKSQAIMKRLLQSEHKPASSHRSPRSSIPGPFSNNEDFNQFQSSLKELRKIIQKKQGNPPPESSPKDYLTLSLPKKPNKISNSVASDTGLIMRLKNIQSYISKLEDEIEAVKI